jgi:hypothetical protein
VPHKEDLFSLYFFVGLDEARQYSPPEAEAEKAAQSPSPQGQEEG